MKMEFYSFFNCFLFALYSYIAGVIIYKKKPLLDKKWLLCMALYIILFYLKINYFSNFFSIYFTYILYAVSHKIIFNKNIFTILIGSIFTLMIKICIEICYVLLGFQAYKDIDIFKYISFSTIILSIIEMLLGIILIYLLRNVIYKIMNYLEKNAKKQFIILIIIYLNIFFVFLLREPHYELNYEVVSEFVIVIIFTLIIFTYLNQESRMEFLIKYYQDIVEYSKLNETLLNDYKMLVHENNNKMLIIKSMISGKKKDLENYVNSILNEEEIIQKNWINDLKYIPIIGVKNFMYFKLSALNELGSTLEIFISPELESVDVSKFDSKCLNDLYTILGVVLDNMIDAVKSSKQKLVSIHLYKDQSSICGCFANSFSGELDIDKLGSMGYSTKGSKRGVGLCLIDNIVKKNKRFTIHSKIIDNFFVQQISLSFSKNTKNHKKKSIYHVSKKIL